MKIITNRRAGLHLRSERLHADGEHPGSSTAAQPQKREQGRNPVRRRSYYVYLPDTSSPRQTQHVTRKPERSVHIPADDRAGLGVSSHGTVQVALRTALGLSQDDHEHNNHRQHPEGQQHQATDLPRRHVYSYTAGGRWEGFTPSVKATALLRVEVEDSGSFGREVSLIWALPPATENHIIF